MTLTEVKLQKLRDLINSLMAGRDALMREGRVDAARIIEMRIQELQRGYDAVLRQGETDRQLKALTKQARDVEKTYLLAETPTEMVRPIGATTPFDAVSTPGLTMPGAVARMKAKKHKKRKGR